MGVSDWGDKGSVIKGDVDVAIPCGFFEDLLRFLGALWDSGLLPLRWEVYRTWVMKNKNEDVYQ
jgi:hypothetical protein